MLSASLIRTSQIIRTIVHIPIDSTDWTFPLRESPSVMLEQKTEWKKLAQNLQLKVGLPASPTSPPPPPLQVGNWTGFTKKKFSFFSFRKSTEKKISYILLSTVTHLY